MLLEIDFNRPKSVTENRIRFNRKKWNLKGKWFSSYFFKLYVFNLKLIQDLKVLSKVLFKFPKKSAHGKLVFARRTHKASWKNPEKGAPEKKLKRKYFRKKSSWLLLQFVIVDMKCIFILLEEI